MPDRERGVQPAASHTALQHAGQAAARASLGNAQHSRVPAHLATRRWRRWRRALRSGSVPPPRVAPPSRAWRPPSLRTVRPQQLEAPDRLRERRHVEEQQLPDGRARVVGPPRALGRRQRVVGQRQRKLAPRRDLPPAVCCGGQASGDSAGRVAAGNPVESAPVWGATGGERNALPGCVVKGGTVGLEPQTASQPRPSSPPADQHAGHDAQPADLQRGGEPRSAAQQSVGQEKSTAPRLAQPDMARMCGATVGAKPGQAGRLAAAGGSGADDDGRGTRQYLRADRERKF